MSIPPLVCSTPPPPDQCDDDKEDVEGIDLRYSNFSQEDEEENEDYGYERHYLPYSGSHNVLNNQNKVENPIENRNQYDGTFIQNINEVPYLEMPDIENDVILKPDIATVIEDLDLKLEKVAILPDNINEVDNICDSNSIPCNNNKIKIHNEQLEKAISHTCTHEEGESPGRDSPTVVNNDNECLELNIEQSDRISSIDINDSNEFNITENDRQTVFLENHEDELKRNQTINDFDEFEDFQYSSNTAQIKIEENLDNPWQTNSNDDVNSFSDFKADFDDNIEMEIKPTLLTIEQKLDELKDDFGDFDDFRSSKESSCAADSISNTVNIINFHSNETQILESINNILLSVFNEEIPEINEEIDGNLLSVASETWHHLKEVDVRQPYIINWNNSLGQKSLLKALCIDSRNILFVPKWNNTTPKYAANLSVSPLQPQKPQTSANTPQSETTNVDQGSSKEPWTDPFNSNGQESTYAEALLLDLEHLMATLDQMAHKNSTLKISELLLNASHKENEKIGNENKSDIETFNNTVSVVNLDKIHSSTLSVQPLRHINLPDTHIFTPVDSEVPRSKTIHYDNGHVMPKQTLDVQKDTLSSSQDAKTQHEDDEWEFQDFKQVSGALPDSGKLEENSGDSSEHNVTQVSLPEVTYQTQLLQPVKIEPIMPTLNWPDPGEVKETFDDFAHFSASTAWSEENKRKLNTNTMSIPVYNKDVIYDVTTNVDDEFDTFQSAPVSKNKSINYMNDKITTNHNLQNKTEVLLTNLEALPNEISQNHIKTIQSTNKLNIIKDSTTNSPKLNPNILQPINAPTASYTQQSGQILQPLSLEGYSQINWPKPGVDLQDLSSFNPLESLQSLKSNSGSSGTSKVATPEHTKSNTVHNDISDDDIWGDFVSSKPHPSPLKKMTAPDDDEWTDFVSNSSVPQKTLNTISFNVHTNKNQKPSNHIAKPTQIPIEIPTLNYITPNSNNPGVFIEKHFQNL